MGQAQRYCPCGSFENDSAFRDWGHGSAWPVRALSPATVICSGMDMQPCAPQTPWDVLFLKEDLSTSRNPRLLKVIQSCQCRTENLNSVPLTMLMGAKQGGGKHPQGQHPEGYTACCLFHPSYLCLTSPSLLFWVVLRQSQHWSSSSRARKTVKIKIDSKDTETIKTGLILKDYESLRYLCNSCLLTNWPAVDWVFKEVVVP